MATPLEGVQWRMGGGGGACILFIALSSLWEFVILTPSGGMCTHMCMCATANKFCDDDVTFFVCCV